MRSSTTIYSGRTTLGKETFGQLHEVTSSEEHVYIKRVQSTYCNPSRCIRVANYRDLNALRASFRAKYFTNQDTIKNQKNSLVSGLYTTLDLNNVDVIASNTNPAVSPTPIDVVSVPYLNYKVGNTYALNKILHL